MNTLKLVRGIVAGALLCIVAGLSRADEGMWLLNRPPVKLLKDKHGFEPDKHWLDHLQKSCVRFSTGGSGSIISGDGLVMTNHHVGSDNLDQLSTAERNLLRDGFYAKTQAEELKVPDLELLCLWNIEDVTLRVNSAAAAGMSPADANTARRKIMTAIEEEAEKNSGLDCEVVTLWDGGQYHLYSYKRYTDIRLVMAPEEDIAFFGGDNDNFEFPRFDLDMCFFRIYVEDKPLKPEHHLKWSVNGATENDLALVCGHPGNTERGYTVDHLKFLRDVDFPFTLNNVWQREISLFTFINRNDECARIGRNDYMGVQNSRKAFMGIQDGLLNPELFKTKIAQERMLRQTILANSDWREQWDGAWDQIRKSQQMYRSFFSRYQILERRGHLRSTLLGYARDLVRLGEEKPKPNADRLREYRDSELDSLELELFSPAPVYEELEIERLACGLTWMAMTLGGDNPLVITTLAGKSPAERARELITATTLKDIEVRKKLAEGGKKAVIASTDPLIHLALGLDAASRAVRKQYEDDIEGVERDAYAKIAAARFAIEGANTYPDATFTLRLAFGPIKGYQENGAPIAAFTTLGGTYELMARRHGEPPYKLPQRWIERKNTLDLKTPFNFVCTADIIGGNSGSPVVNKAGEVIGLIFDGNRQSLIWDIQYTDVQGRAIAVDSRAIIECLRKLYDAGPLADEITR